MSETTFFYTASVNNAGVSADLPDNDHSQTSHERDEMSDVTSATDFEGGPHGDGNSETTLTSPGRGARFVLSVGILTGLSAVIALPYVSPEQLMLATDVYYYATDSLLEGGAIYEVAPPNRSGYYFIYPPVVAFAFVPHVLTGSPLGAYLLQTVLNVGFASGIAVTLWRALGRRGFDLSWVDAGLLFGFALVSAYSAISLINGQVNIGLGLAIAVGLDSLDRDRGSVAGVAFSLAALVKVFPAVLGLWLLRRRAHRDVLIAVTVGLSGLLVGLLALGPEVTTTYVTDVLTGRYDGFDGSPDPTQTRDGAQRQIAALFGLGPPLLTPLAALALAPVLGYLYLDVGTDVQRQATALGTILVTLLFLPLQRLYMVLFVFPLVLLLYQLPSGRSRIALLGGTLVSFARIDFTIAEAILTALPLRVVEGPLLASVERFFEVMLPPTLGMWLLLGACVLIQYDARSGLPSGDGT